jgi:hypothetical protein
VTIHIHLPPQLAAEHARERETLRVLKDAIVRILQDDKARLEAVVSPSEPATPTAGPVTRDARQAEAFRGLEEPIVELVRAVTGVRLLLWDVFGLDRLDEEIVTISAPRAHVEAAIQSVINVERFAEGLERDWYEHA